MRAARSLPARYEAARPKTLEAANDSYGEVTVGGLNTACLSRDGLARMMLQDCLDARADPQSPSQAGLRLQRPCHRAGRPGRSLPLHFRAGRHHPCRRPGRGVRLAPDQRRPIPERSATTDFIHDAARIAAQHGLRFFLLGATEEANAKAARILAQTYPGLQIVGRRHGYFSRDEEDEICDEINLTLPDVIWVGLSVPLEYEFAVRNKARLSAGWLVTCGGCYNFITGAYARAPALDAGRRPGMAVPPDPRAQKAVLALCRDQSACDFFTFDAHKFGFSGAIGLHVHDDLRHRRATGLAGWRMPGGLLAHRLALWRLGLPARSRCRARISSPR